MKEIMTKRELAELYRVSTTTVDNWVLRGLVKTKIGKLTRFKKDDVVAFISGGKA